MTDTKSLSLREKVIALRDDMNAALNSGAFFNPELFGAMLLREDNPVLRWRDQLDTLLSGIRGGAAAKEEEAARMDTSSGLNAPLKPESQAASDVQARIKKLLNAENARLLQWAKDEEKNPYEAHAYKTAAHAVRMLRDPIDAAFDSARTPADVQAVITEAEGLLKEIGADADWQADHDWRDDGADQVVEAHGRHLTVCFIATGMPTELHQARTTFIAAAPRLVRKLIAALCASVVSQEQR
jgi:hypothetical protein